MFLKILGSSSTGNCYLLDSGTSVLIIEAGVPFISVKKILNFDLSKIAGLIYSHKHGDHYKYIKQYSSAGIKIFDDLEPNKPFKADKFKIKPFSVKHDIECLGYMIKHPDMGLCIFVTDTHYIPFKFKGLNNLIIEANYDEEILEKNINSGKTQMIVRDRVLNSHMSLQTLKTALSENDLSQVNNIVLIHLSKDNADPDKFQKEIKQLTGKQVWIAKKGLEIPFNKEPF